MPAQSQPIHVDLVRTKHELHISFLVLLVINYFAAEYPFSWARQIIVFSATIAVDHDSRQMLVNDKWHNLAHTFAVAEYNGMIWRIWSNSRYRNTVNCPKQEEDKEVSYFMWAVRLQGIYIIAFVVYILPIPVVVVDFVRIEMQFDVRWEESALTNVVTWIGS